MSDLQNNERITDALLRNDLRKLNAHLPKERRTLAELLNDPSPSVTSVSGDKIRMRKRELDELSNALPEFAKEKVRLPIILLRRTDLGSGAFTVLGDLYEEFAMSILSQSALVDFEEFRRQRSSPPVFYKPQISELLRRFHSLVTIGFGTIGRE